MNMYIAVCKVDAGKTRYEVIRNPTWSIPRSARPRHSEFDRDRHVVTGDAGRAVSPPVLPVVEFVMSGDAHCAVRIDQPPRADHADHQHPILAILRSASSCAGLLRDHELRSGAVLRRACLRHRAGGRDLEYSSCGNPALAMLVGLVLARRSRRSAAGQEDTTPIFIALGTLTGAYARSGWYPAGSMWGGNGLSSIKLLQADPTSSSRASSSTSRVRVSAGVYVASRF